MIHALMLVLLLLASPALADPIIADVPLEGADLIVRPALSLTELDVFTDPFFGFLKDCCGQGGLFTGVAGTAVHFVFNVVGGTATWVYQGVIYRSQDGVDTDPANCCGQPAHVTWSDETDVDLVLGFDTALASLSGSVSFTNPDYSPLASFDFSSPGRASILNTVNADGSITASVFTVSFPAPVPEPATWVLLVSGLVGLVLWRKRTA